MIDDASQGGIGIKGTGFYVGIILIMVGGILLYMGWNSFNTEDAPHKKPVYEEITQEDTTIVNNILCMFGVGIILLIVGICMVIQGWLEDR